MKYNIYAYKDEKVQFLPNVICDIDDENAIRQVCVAFAKVPITFGRPADYSLYRIGSFDTETGVLTPCEHVFLINGESARLRGIEILKEAEKELEFIEKLRSLTGESHFVDVCDKKPSDTQEVDENENADTQRPND